MRAAVLDDLETLRTSEARRRNATNSARCLQRTRADFENYQKRTQREWPASGSTPTRPGATCCRRSITSSGPTEAAKQAGETGPLVQGVAMVQAQVLDVLRRHGITRMEAPGSRSTPISTRP